MMERCQNFMVQLPILLVIMLLIPEAFTDPPISNSTFTKEGDEPISKSSEMKNEANTNNNNVLIYQKLFLHQRGFQKEAITSLLQMTPVNQYKFVKSMMDEIFKVLEKARNNITKWGHLPDDPFPQNETIRNSVSKILENTALFGDLMLKLPEISHELYDKQNVWNVMMEWCIHFCQESGMFDKLHLKLLDTLNQELELVPRDPKYLNPYRKMNKESPKEEYPKPKTKQKRKGPKLSQ